MENDLLHRMDWKIPSSRLQIRELKLLSDRSFKSLGGKSGSSCAISTKTDASNGTMLSLSGQIFTQVAVLDGQLVAIKPIHKACVAVTKDVIMEINQIRNLKYKTINQLIGACVEPQKISLIATYCAKGSLQDVLQNDNIKLDWIFKVSFISDIVRGMTFLHDSPVECHGRLKSSNVLVDNHWCCKIDDISMPFFRAAESTTVLGQYQQNCKKLWTAPEILRDPKAYIRGSRKGDVYSFALILQEIILRTGPYGNEATDPEEIIERVKFGECPPYRPHVPNGLVPDVVTDIMRNCWEENPTARPSFQMIGEIVRKKVNKGKTTNIIDQMIHMLSNYADHLEDLVADRTKQLEDEQRKTDELLCRMLPATIANDLKQGNTVEPENYEACTVFFSDIVGFTTLAASSSPLEIVEFLNDLYTCFDTIIDLYDVYKVETIGDAYMVASGLPVRNGNRHAGEIATMALDLLASMSIFTIKHRPDKTLQLRTGMHSGPVAAGVVGQKMPRYCLFGDTVNYASRMESSGLALRIHVSPECKGVLDELGGFHLESRGEVTMKGKGTISTFFLVGKDGFYKELPSLELQAPLSQHTFK
ncbi:atrial natriuretic peptide receptor 1 isoform X2 [Patella vulgata]|nr:atrial natriuretic peptide receptor 1 isoform X2 [Patella vulgata]